jgi:hypothetical protein
MQTKIKTSTIIWLVVGFLWSIFMGVTAISMGFGALFPSLNLIAGPLICPQGQMVLEENVSRPFPGTTYTILHWYCVNAQSGTKTELNPFTINLYAGPVYGVLLFVIGLGIWYFYSQRDSSKDSPQTRMWISRVQTGGVILLVAALILIGLMPLFGSIKTALEPTSTPEVAATSLAATFEALSSGTPVAFDSTEKPLTNWNDVPVMPQATAGQQTNEHSYTFRVPVDSGTVESFYHEQLKSLGWNLEEDQWLGMKFSKNKITLLVTLAPDSDLQSWVVTLVLTP